MNNSVNYEIKFRDRASQVLGKISGKCKDITDAIEEATSCTSRFNKIINQLKFPQINAFLDVVGKYSSAVSSLTDTGISFEQSMADLSSITGIVGDDLEELTEKARRYGKESGLGASTAARAYTILASQIQVSEIGMEGLNSLQQNSITLAQAAGMTIDAAANSLAGTINQFGLAADQADRVINVLAAGSKYGAAEIEELAMSFKVVGASASAMGLSVEDTAGALEVLSKANLKGGEAGTNLRNVILKLSTTLGYDFKNTSLAEALDDLKPKLDDVTFLSKTFGMESVAAAQFLIGNADAVAKMTAAVTDTNTAHEQAAIRTETTAQKLAELRAKVDDIKIGIADVMGPMAAWGTVIADNSTNILALVQLSGNLIGIIPKLISGVGKLASSELAHKAAMAAATVAARAYAVAQRLVNAVLTMNPLGIVITAITALVAAIVVAYKKCDSFRALCDKVWASVKRIADAVWQFLVKAFEKASEVIQKAWQWIRRFFGGNKESASAIEDTTSAIHDETGAIEDNINVTDLSTTTNSNFVESENDKKNAVQQAVDAYNELSSTLENIAKVNEIFGESENTLSEQRDAVRQTIEKILPVLGTESTYVQNLIKKYGELGAAMRAVDKERTGTLATVDSSMLKGTATTSSNTNLHAVDHIADAERLASAYEAARQRYENLRDLLATPGLTEVQKDAITSLMTQLDGLWNITESATASGENMVLALNTVGDAMGKLNGVVNEGAGAWMNYISNVISSVTSAIPMIMALKEAHRAKANAQAADSLTGVAASVASVPILGPVLALGAVASLAAALMAVPKFAAGGLAYGPTLGLFGEYSGASHNPEVVAPLDRLRALIRPDGGTDKLVVEMRLQQRTLVGATTKYNRYRSRI